MLGDGENAEESVGTNAAGTRLGGNEGVGVRNIVGAVIGLGEDPGDSVGSGNAVGAGDGLAVITADGIAEGTENIEILGVAEGIGFSVGSLEDVCPATLHRSPTRARNFKFKVATLMIQPGDKRRQFDFGNRCNVLIS
jgi:hypothetical protein